MLYSVGSFKNVEDVNKKLQKYKETLDLQSQLQQRQEEANKAVYKMGQVQPVPATQMPKYGSVEEEMADENAQSQQMMEILQTIFKYPKDAKRAYDLFVDEGYLPADFNRLSGEFLQVIKNIRNITPEFFMRNWERFYTQVQSFGDSLVNIGIMDNAQKNAERQILLRVFNQYIRPRYTPEIAEESRRAIQYVIDNPQRPTLQDEKEVMVETPEHQAARDIISIYQNDQLDQDQKASEIDRNMTEILSVVPSEVLEPKLTKAEKTTFLTPQFTRDVPIEVLKEKIRKTQLDPIEKSPAELKKILLQKDFKEETERDYIPVVADYLNMTPVQYEKQSKPQLQQLFKKVYGNMPGNSSYTKDNLKYLLARNIGDALVSSFSEYEAGYKFEREAKEAEAKRRREIGKLPREVIQKAEERGFLIESKESEFTNPLRRLFEFDGSINPEYEAEYEPQRRGSIGAYGDEPVRGLSEGQKKSIGELFEEDKNVNEFLIENNLKNLISDKTKDFLTNDYVEKTDFIKKYINEAAQKLNIVESANPVITFNQIKSRIWKEVDDILKGKKEQQGQGLRVIPSKKNIIHTKPRYIIGHGIDPMPTERFITFGNYLINKPLLFNQNRLAVKYPSQAQVKDIPSQTISQEFTELLKYIIKNKRVDYKLYNSLSKKETQIFHKLINKARLDQYLGFEGYTNDEEDKQMKRFELLRGEVLAGNNNREVLKELRDLIMNFMATNKLRKTEGNQILYEINSII